MPLLYGSQSSGGYGGIRPRIGNQANKWQEQMRRNPNFGSAWKKPEPESQQEQPGAPKLGTPRPAQAQPRPELDAIQQLMQTRMNTGGFSGPGGFQGAFKSEAIPMSIAGIPGTNQGISRGVLNYLPEQLRKMMGV